MTIYIKYLLDTNRTQTKIIQKLHNTYHQTIKKLHLLWKQGKKPQPTTTYQHDIYNQAKHFLSIKIRLHKLGHNSNCIGNNTIHLTPKSYTLTHKSIIINQKIELKIRNKVYNTNIEKEIPTIIYRDLNTYYWYIIVPYTSDPRNIYNYNIEGMKEPERKWLYKTANKLNNLMKFGRKTKKTEKTIQYLQSLISNRIKSKQQSIADKNKYWDQIKKSKPVFNPNQTLTIEKPIEKPIEISKEEKQKRISQEIKSVLEKCKKMKPWKREGKISRMRRETAELDEIIKKINKNANQRHNF